MIIRGALFHPPLFPFSQKLIKLLEPLTKLAIRISLDFFFFLIIDKQMDCFQRIVYHEGKVLSSPRQPILAVCILLVCLTWNKHIRHLLPFETRIAALSA